MACKSPFNLGLEEGSLFLNYWNVNQCFYMKGLSNLDMIEKMVKVMQLRNPTVEIVRKPDQSLVNPDKQRQFSMMKELNTTA